MLKMPTTQQRLLRAAGVDGRQWAPYANESITHRHGGKSVIKNSCRSNDDCNCGRGLPVCRSLCWQNELSLDVQQVWKWSSDSRPVPHPLGSLPCSTQSLSANMITNNAWLLAQLFWLWNRIEDVNKFRRFPQVHRRKVGSASNCSYQTCDIIPLAIQKTHVSSHPYWTLPTRTEETRSIERLAVHTHQIAYTHPPHPSSVKTWTVGYLQNCRSRPSCCLGKEHKMISQVRRKNPNVSHRPPPQRWDRTDCLCTISPRYPPAAWTPSCTVHLSGRSDAVEPVSSVPPLGDAKNAKQLTALRNP